MTQQVPTNLKQAGDELWKRMEKVPAELFHHLYGAMVVDIWRQSGGNAETANKRLDSLGHSIGVRLIEEVCARSPLLSATFESTNSAAFREVVEAFVRTAFKMYLNITPSIESNDSSREAIVTLSPSADENILALTKNVVLPDDARNSRFSYLQPYCGLIRGALESVMWKTEVSIVSDVLKGDSQTEILIKFVERLDEERPPKDE